MSDVERLLRHAQHDIEKALLVLEQLAPETDQWKIAEIRALLEQSRKALHMRQHARPDGV